MNRTIAFTKEAQVIVEEYMQENNCSFNKAVNTLIISNKETDLSQTIKKSYKGINTIYKFLVDNIKPQG